MSEKVLIVGAGGREHALARQLALSPGRPGILAAPGNPGTAALGRNIDLDPADADALAEFCRADGVGTVIVGPEDPLIAGLADRLRAAGVDVFGPGAEGARLEGDKRHAKELMAAAGVPTAAYRAFTDHAEAAAHLESASYPLVVKACGAAQGKGVAVCADAAAAREHLDRCLLDRSFGAAGAEVLVEECLSGPELSVLAVTDGVDFALLAPSRDHKRAGDGDRGPNTGGMGAFAPVALAPGLGPTIAGKIVAPVLAELRRRGVDYRGILYVGLMLTPEGPKVLEFNCRFGDPETQVVLPLLRCDFLGLVRAAARAELGGWLARQPAPGPGAPEGWPGAGLTDWERAAVVVVGAAPGYPGPYARGTVLGLPGGEGPERWIVHAGTRRDGDRLVSAGGRVLGAVGLGDDFGAARAAAYGLIESIEFEDMHYRRDIGAGYAG